MRKTTSRISACAWARRARRIALVRRAFLCAHQLSQIGRYLNRGLGSYWHACYAWTRLLPGSSLHHNRFNVSQGVARCSHLSRCAKPASRSLRLPLPRCLPLRPGVSSPTSTSAPALPWPRAATAAVMAAVTEAVTEGNGGGKGGGNNDTSSDTAGSGK